MFWVNVPIGIFGTIWSYRSLREIGTRNRAKIDWWGNVIFALGAGLLLVAITYGIQPYGGHATGWTSPRVIGGMVAGVVLLAIFCLIETRIAEPMFRLGLFKIRACAAGNNASLMGSIAPGGLQFMLIIWLQGVWLRRTRLQFRPDPATRGHLLAAADGRLPDRRPDLGHLVGPVRPPAIRHRRPARLGEAAFGGLLLLPVNFSYWTFALIIFGNGLGSGLFASPNTSAIMSSVPAKYRGSASGMRSTFQNSGTALSIGVFFLADDQQAWPRRCRKR